MTTPAKPPASIETLFEELLAPDAAGESRCTRRELEDVMAVIFLKSHQRTPMSSVNSDAFIGAFFTRVGLQSEDQLDQLDELIRDYFVAHPLRQDVLEDVLEVMRPAASLRNVRAGYAIGGAF